jgi:hypothetical protein
LCPTIYSHKFIDEINSANTFWIAFPALIARIFDIPCITVEFKGISNPSGFIM